MASAVVGALRVLLSADTAQFEKALTGADADVKKLANTMKRDLEPSQARVNSLVRAFVGSKEIGNAREFAIAIHKVGGAANLAASDQVKANRAMQEAIGHYKAIGKDAPMWMQKVADATKQVQAPTQQLNTGLTGLMGTLKALGGAFGVTLGAVAIGSFVKDIVAQGLKLEGVRNAFHNLTAGMKLDSEALFEAMQTGTRGMVGSVDLFQTANKAMLLGLPVTVESMGEMSKAATRLGKAMGIDATTALDNLITALGRTSPLILDNLGLTVKVGDANEAYAKSLGKSVDALTEVEKKMAFYNAAMDAARLKSEELGEQALTLAEQFNIAWISIKDGASSVAAWLNTTLGVGVQRLGDHIAYIYGLANNLPMLSANEKEAAREMAKARAGAPNIVSPFAITVPAIGLADDALKAFNLTNGESIKQIEKHITAAERLEEAYRSFERARLTGATDSQRQQREFEARFLRDRGLTSAYAAMSSVISKTINFGPLLGGSFTMPFKPAPSSTLPVGAMDPKVFAKLTQGGLTSADLAQFVPHASMRSLFSGGLSSSFSMAPNVIMQALMGGGSVSKSLGSLFGSNIGGNIIGQSTDGIFAGGLGKMLQDSMGKKIGGFVANLIPGIGALLGPALGKLFGALGNIGKNTTKQDRESFGQQFGGLDSLYKQLQGMGAAGAALANTGLNVIGKKDKAANEKWMADVTKFLDSSKQKFAALTSAVEAFGGVAPKAVRPLIESLLQTGNLTDDMRAQLQGLMGKPTWQSALDTANALGVDPAMLGAGFNQARVASNAFTLQHQIEQLAEFNANVADFLPGVGDELSALVKDAIKTGAALPKTLEPYIRQLDAMGLLLDENGERIDMGALAFKDIEDESLKAIKDVLEEIRDLLAGKLPDAVRKFGDALGQLPVDAAGVGFRMPRQLDDYGGLQMPDASGIGWSSYAGASYAGTTPQGESGGVTVILEQDGRATARWLVPYIPNEVERLRLA